MIDKTRSSSAGPAALARVARSVIVVVAASVVLSGCTDDPEPGSSALISPSQTPSAAMPAMTPGVIEAGFDDLALPAATTLTGVLEVSGDTGRKQLKSTAEIVSVVAGPGSTTLRWRLTVPEKSDLIPQPWHVRGLANTTGVALVVGDQQFRPVMWQEPGNKRNAFIDCGCSRVPYNVGPEGVEMGGVYPALPASATSVEVRIPGFPATTVPLTRP